MASDFPEKVELSRWDSGRVYITDDPDCTRREGRPVQPYFSASLVEELVEALGPFAELADEVDRYRHTDDSTCQHRLRASHLRSARAAVSKAQSSLGVKELETKLEEAESDARLAHDEAFTALARFDAEKRRHGETDAQLEKEAERAEQAERERDRFDKQADELADDANRAEQQAASMREEIAEKDHTLRRVGNWLRKEARSWTGDSSGVLLELAIDCDKALSQPPTDVEEAEAHVCDPERPCEPNDYLCCNHPRSAPQPSAFQDSVRVRVERSRGGLREVVDPDGPYVRVEKAVDAEESKPIREIEKAIEEFEGRAEVAKDLAGRLSGDDAAAQRYSANAFRLVVTFLRSLLQQGGGEGG